MKNFITNIDEAMDLVDQIDQFDVVSMMSIICALIGKVSAKSEEPVRNIIAAIVDAVLTADEVLGPYRPDTEEGHDHKN